MLLTNKVLPTSLSHLFMPSLALSLREILKRHKKEKKHTTRNMAEELREIKREKYGSKEYIRLILKEEKLVLFYKEDRWSEYCLFKDTTIQMK